MRSALFASAVALAGIPATGYGQKPPDAGQILQQQTKEPPREPARPADVLPRVDAPRPALSATPGLKVNVTRFRISGNTVYSEEELLESIKEFVGKEQDIDGLNDAATRVRAYYRARGYFLAQAYLPRQQIRDGVVEIAVIEGRIGKVTLNMKPDVRVSEDLLKSILEAHLQEGSLITETGLEKPLLLINDLPNAIVTSEIRPSATIGAADMQVNVEQVPDLVNGFVDFDNAGSRFTGEYRLGISFNVNSPMRLGDQLTVRAFATEERFLLRRIAYVVPVGSYGTRVGFSYLDFDYRVGKDFSALESHGYGVTASVFGFHPMVRTRRANVILQAAYEDKKLFDRIDSTSTQEDRYVIAYKLGLVGDLRDALFGGGLNSFGATWTEGDVVLSQPGLLAADQGPTGLKTAGKFAKLNYEYRRLQRVTENSNLLLAVAGQRGSKNLTSAEKFSLGGPTGVRAYPVGEAIGDSGIVINAEYRYIVPDLKLQGGDVTVSGFYDIGHVRVNKDPLATETKNERNLAGYGLGLSLGKDGDYLLRAFAAWRAENEAPLADGAKRIPRIWFQAIKWF